MAETHNPDIQREDKESIKQLVEKKGMKVV